jgi:NAD(P)H-dependent flavin oxidoreductase YrpB (nitropropane dioxygenase family)
MSSATHSPSERPFELFGLSPGGLPPRLAQALGRCGATGLLDLVHVADLTGAEAHVTTLINETPGARVGLRLHADQVADVAPWLHTSRERPLTVVLAIAEQSALQQAANTLRDAHPGLTLWVEVTDAEQAPALAAFADGLIAVGHEGGGWVGEDTSLILLQKLQTLTSVPVMARGGLGLHAAAACRIAGACGMVLDDCLLLLSESPLPLAVQQTLQRLNGGECRLLGERIGQPLRVYGKPGSAMLKAAEADDRAAEGEQLDPAA